MSMKQQAFAGLPLKYHPSSKEVFEIGPGGDHEWLYILDDAIRLRPVRISGLLLFKQPKTFIHPKGAAV